MSFNALDATIEQILSATNVATFNVKKPPSVADFTFEDLGWTPLMKGQSHTYYMSDNEYKSTNSAFLPFSRIGVNTTISQNPTYAYNPIFIEEDVSITLQKQFLLIETMITEMLVKLHKSFKLRIDPVKLEEELFRYFANGAASSHRVNACILRRFFVGSSFTAKLKANGEAIGHVDERGDAVDRTKSMYNLLRDSSLPLQSDNTFNIMNNILDSMCQMQLGMLPSMLLDNNADHFENVKCCITGKTEDDKTYVRGMYYGASKFEEDGKEHTVSPIFLFNQKLFRRYEFLRLLVVLSMYLHGFNSVPTNFARKPEHQSIPLCTSISDIRKTDKTKSYVDQAGKSTLKAGRAFRMMLPASVTDGYIEFLSSAWRQEHEPFDMSKITHHIGTSPDDYAYAYSWKYGPNDNSSPTNMFKLQSNSCMRYPVGKIAAKYKEHGFSFDVGLQVTNRGDETLHPSHVYATKDFYISYLTNKAEPCDMSKDAVVYSRANVGVHIDEVTKTVIHELAPLYGSTMETMKGHVGILKAYIAEIDKADETMKHTLMLCSHAQVEESRELELDICVRGWAGLHLRMSETENTGSMNMYINAPYVDVGTAMTVMTTMVDSDGLTLMRILAQNNNKDTHDIDFTIPVVGKSFPPMDDLKLTKNYKNSTDARGYTTLFRVGTSLGFFKSRFYLRDAHRGQIGSTVKLTAKLRLCDNCKNYSTEDFDLKHYAIVNPDKTKCDKFVCSDPECIKYSESLIQMPNMPDEMENLVNGIQDSFGRARTYYLPEHAEFFKQEIGHINFDTSTLSELVPYQLSLSKVRSVSIKSIEEFPNTRTAERAIYKTFAGRTMSLKNLSMGMMKMCHFSGAYGLKNRMLRIPDEKGVLRWCSPVHAVVRLGYQCNSSVFTRKPQTGCEWKDFYALPNDVVHVGVVRKENIYADDGSRALGWVRRDRETYAMTRSFAEKASNPESNVFALSQSYKLLKLDNENGLTGYFIVIK